MSNQSSVIYFPQTNHSSVSTDTSPTLRHYPNQSSVIYFPQTNHSSVSTDTSPTLRHYHFLIIIIGSLVVCFCSVFTLIYCVETIENRRRRTARLAIIPENNII